MQQFWTIERKMGLVAFAVLTVLNVFAWKDVWYFSSPRNLKVEVLNIGQGDSIFIQTPDMRHMIIDGGPGNAVMGKLSQRLPLWDRHFDVVVLTHPDADHLNGLLQVLKKYRVDYIVWTGIVRDGQGYQEWLSLLEKQKKMGSHIIIANKGTVINNGGVAMQILHPFENLEGQFSKATNDTGIVARLAYGKNSFLFTADISSNVEKEFIDHGISLASDVIKVAHHGSKYSSSVEFFQAAKPKLATISVGASNTYGHPTPEVLQRLADFGITTMRTDRDGDITITSNGNTISVAK